MVKNYCNRNVNVFQFSSFYKAKIGNKKYDNREPYREPCRKKNNFNS
jgi:hypothetical protein